jgi:predicted AlkP superfamily pyrophosphatase or phosphodiesterase
MEAITMKKLLAGLLLVVALLPAQQNRLLVVSIDGLDHRWLRDADELGVKIPTLRRLMREGVRADGVVGIVPTVTWPSHTTMISGVSAPKHGIISNNQPDKPGHRWWYVSYLKARTLWHLTHAKGQRSAAVWWPVTVGADIDFNLPEFWEDPNHYPRLLAPVASRGTPGLTGRIRAAYPAFGKAHFDDHQKALAARFILEAEKPALFLLHLGDLDSAQHATGAFSANAKATLEHQDELIGYILEVLPERTFVVIVSDHGFETEELALRPKVLLAGEGIEAEVLIAEGLFGVTDPEAAKYFRSLAGKRKTGVAREVPMAEVRAMAPSLAHWRAAFEPVMGVTAKAAGITAKDASGEAPAGLGDQRGHHGLWPTRSDYRASFVVWGPGIAPKLIPEISMLDIAPTLADILGVKLPEIEGRSLWGAIQSQ